MYYALRVNDYLVLVGFKVKEPFRLYHFKSLIHEGCTIDGNPCTHGPIWVLQSMIPFYIYQEVGFLTPKRAAAGSKNHFFYPVPRFTYGTLENSRMFAVYRNKRYP